MQEMVTRAQADLLFLILPVLGLIAGPVAGIVARKSGGSPALAAMLWGGPLVLIGILWRVYNTITDRIGLDSVANLAVNFCLFIIVGVLCGIVWTMLTARRNPETVTDSANINKKTEGS
jgi:nitrate/nitrite transporter NarK